MSKNRNKKIWAIIGASAVVIAGAAVVIAAEVRKFRKSLKVVAESIELDEDCGFDCEPTCCDIECCEDDE